MAEKPDLTDKEKLDKLLRDEQLNDLRFILETEQGMRFFKRFFESGYIFRTTFTGNGWAGFNEGRRALALEFMSDICEAAPDKVAPLFIKKPDEEKEIASES